MNIDADRTQGKERAPSTDAAYKPKPFVTILDDRPSARKKPRQTQAPAPRRGSPLRKSGTILRSYADEGVENAAAAAASLGSSTLKSFVSLSKKLASGAADTRSAIAKSMNAKRAAALAKREMKASRVSVPDSAPPVENSLDPQSAGGQASASVLPNEPLQSVKKPFDLSALAGRARDLASRLLAERPRALHAPKIALSALIAVLALTAAAAAIIDARQFPIGASSILLPDEDSAQAALMAYLEPEDLDEDKPQGALPPLPVLVSIKPYTVRSSDTLDKIAKRFGLRQDTIISANNLASASSIRAGVQLRIPNINGVSHKVRRGENLSSVAKTYGIDITQIVDANDLTSGTINAGQNLFIPNARLSSSSMKNFYGEQFIWPARGGISSPFGYRSNPFSGLRTYHAAIDIVVSLGTKVKATCEGKVADTGYNSVFGNYVILKHASGYQSLYAHLSQILVREGSSVAQGTIVGLSGNTGQSTGPHLHFSIFKNGQAVDPRKYVK
jgi:murein DD-endopeptidase MepM/ murein hydrolase activator NlpD